MEFINVFFEDICMDFNIDPKETLGSLEGRPYEMILNSDSQTISRLFFFWSQIYANLKNSLMDLQSQFDMMIAENYETCRKDFRDKFRDGKNTGLTETAIQNYMMVTLETYRILQEKIITRKKQINTVKYIVEMLRYKYTLLNV